MTYSCSDMAEDIEVELNRLKFPRLTVAQCAELDIERESLDELSARTLNAIYAFGELTAAMRRLLDAMESPRSRRASDAWDAAFAILTKLGI